MKQTGDEAGKHYLGIGIPDELYWRFKKVQAERRESSRQALETAIYLYIEAIPQAAEEETTNGE